MSSLHLLRPTPAQLRALAAATEARDNAESRAVTMRASTVSYVGAMTLDFRGILRNLAPADSPLVAKIYRLVGEQLVDLVDKAMLEFMDEENAAREALGLPRLGRPEDVDPRHPTDSITPNHPTDGTPR